jgi:iron complex outermembrane receptor protein
MRLNTRPFASKLVTGLVVAALTGSNVAAAESNQATELLEEVVVTAQNRVENVQRVPIAITVVSAEKIAEAGFSSMNDMAKIAPAVQITNDNSAVRVTVRGVGTNSSDEAQDTSVVVNIDGEYINRPQVLAVSLFDLERVEVLRGPQGTLYGRNSTGGAINFITRKPGDKLAFNGNASFGNYGATNVDAGVDVPLGEIGGIRLSGIYADHDGYFSHPAAAIGPPNAPLASSPAARSGSEKNSAGRASLSLNPTAALTVNLAFEYGKRDYVNPAVGSADLNSGGRGPTGPGCNAAGFVRVAPNYGNTYCIPQNTNFLAAIDRKSPFAQPVFGVGGYSQDSTAARARLAYEFSPAVTLTYVGGYRDSGQTGRQGLPVVYQTITFQADTKTQSHELRLNGDIGRVTYQVGGFYFKEQLDGVNGFAIPVPSFSNPSFLSYFGRAVDSKSKSLFGQIEVPMTDTLKAVAGLRFTDNERSALYRNSAPLFGQGLARKDFNAIGASRLILGNEERKTTWLIGLNYTPDDRTLIYGKVSTGFKGGGFDSVGDYKPESNTAVEAGLKKNFGTNGQHYFNVGAFAYDYKDLQSSVLLDIAVGGQTFNAGKAKIQGLEVETGLKLTSNDSLTASVNYVKAEYDEFLGQFNVYCVTAGCPASGGPANGIGDLDPTVAGIQQPNFAGNSLPNSPKIVIALGYDHTFSLGNAGTLKASLDSRYKSSYFTDFFNYHDSQQKAYTQSDLSLEYKPQSGHFGVQAFVRNLEDERPLTNAGFVSAGPDDIFNFQFGQPRIYGVRLSVNY